MLHQAKELSAASEERQVRFSRRDLSRTNGTDCSPQIVVYEPTGEPDGKPLNLLDLPPEMRNRIWREVLVSPDRIQIDDSHYQQPALLNCCWQISDEACSIYYGENHFVIQVAGLQSGAVASWCQHSLHYQKLFKRVTYDLTTLADQEKGKWSDLLKWLLRCHDRDVPPYKTSSKNFPPRQLAHRLFRTVWLMLDVEWKIVEEVLNNQMMVFEESTTSGFFFTDREKVQES